VTNGGYEYNAVLIAALAALVEKGPGRPSVDAVLLPRFNGPAWVALGLGAGAAGSFLNEQLFTEPPPEAPETVPESAQASEPQTAGVDAS
jgi:putative oxidoreductase